MDNLILYKCPFSKIRIGSQYDGGYIIADLPNKYDLFISGGIANNITFELDFLNKYPGLICYAFDGTINGLPNNTNENLKFIKKNLSNFNSQNTTDLCEYMTAYNNIFMKMDIEGHEFRIMPILIQNNYINKIKQLVIEIHSPADIELYPTYFKGLSDIKNEQMFNLLNLLNKTHTLVHFHANNGCKMNNIDGISIPHVFELTYIRNEFAVEKIRNTESLPTELDRPNVPYKSDYSLTGHPYTL